MHLACYLDLRNPPGWRRRSADVFAAALDLVTEAERLGASRIWLSEHHFFEDGYLPQPLTFAAAIAARTSRIRVGTAVLLAGLRPAVQVAEESAVVDLISDGRLDLGVGVGYRIPEYAAYGADITDRYGLLERRIGEIRTWWRERVTPQPVQPEIPFWGGFFGPRGARLAGRLGMGLLSMRRDVVTHYLAACTAPARISANVQVIVSDDPERDWPRIKPHLEYMWNSYHAYGAEGTGKPPPPPIDAEAWRRWTPDGQPPRFQVLTPSDTVAHIKTVTAGLPVGELYAWSSIAGMPDDLVQRHQRLWLTEVAPAVADLDPSATPAIRQEIGDE
ncbi:LLM class flavin-dependent oxidoreductase [Micromonospora radicis]|uniref:LLM class flavin-dependent oxidoreductase n=1 Tax=Micromonospora radicis TaxID=1894971 RepID=A0A418MWT4_9ACTN|nr:LLM class flavin-dependent oxidoreductase [Micromonospora radicis]RIV39209.1 LLM class flavin-dependent oxidoreductase [Micromonospora radicis]